MAIEEPAQILTAEAYGGGVIQIINNIVGLILEDSQAPFKSTKIPQTNQKRHEKV